MMRCLAIDDEPLALDLISDYISKIPFLELVQTTTSAIEGLQLIQSRQIDLVFLDIQMPEITGLQFMKIANDRCRIILTTAYSEYALDGFEHNVVDYLLKPFSFERFYKAVEKAKLAGELQQSNNFREQPNASKATDTFIFIKTDSKIVKVDLPDILFIEGLKDYISIITRQDKLITLQNLKIMEEGLPPDQFLRVHKSYIIAINKIDTIEKNRIFIDNHVIPIGETYRENFFKSIAAKNFR
jgi:two-component system, LytTR family, response regulator